MHETIFSTREFVEAWSKGLGKAERPFAIPVHDSGPPRTMYAVESIERCGFRSISLGPAGLYASPGWNGQLRKSTLQVILHRLRRLRTKQFVWSVRFDHQPLASGLTSSGLVPFKSSTQVLYLGRDYADVFAGYNATIRNQVRRAQREGVRIREASDPDSVRDYYQLFTRLAAQKEDCGTPYPLELFLELAKLRDSVRVLLADYRGRLLGGGVFIRDGSSVMYWHGFADREYSRLYPSCAVIDKAVQWACEIRADFLNLGGSAGIASLEQFKSFWGARHELNWRFQWTSALWRQLRRLEARIGTYHAG